MPRAKKRSPAKATSGSPTPGQPKAAIPTVDAQLVMSVAETMAGMENLEGRVISMEGTLSRISSVLSSVQSSLEGRQQSRGRSRAEGRQEEEVEEASRPSRSRRCQSPPPRIHWSLTRQSRSPRRGSSSGRHQRSRSSSRGSSVPRWSSPSQKPRGKDDRPYDQKNFVDRYTKVDSIEALLLISIRTVSVLIDQGYESKDILGVLDHAELICEKALTKIYKPSALVTYDRVVRSRANTEGLGVFGQVKSSDVLRYFSYDAVSVKSKSDKKAPSGQGSSSEKRPCFAFNKKEGCKIVGCRYTHQCMFCRASSHGAASCPGGEKPTK